jgi:uncharacterized membrane protein YqjE
LVALFFLNIIALLPVVSITKDPTPHENAVIAGMWVYMLLNTAGMGWCLWKILPAAADVYALPEFLIQASGW